MAVLLNCTFDFGNAVRNGSNVYAVASTKALTLTNIEDKNELTSLLTNYRDDEFFRHTIVEMSEDTPGVYKATFLQSVADTDTDNVNLTDPTNKANLVDGATYYVYVMVDSRYTDAKNKTALHVFKEIAN